MRNLISFAKKLVLYIINPLYTLEIYQFEVLMQLQIRNKFNKLKYS